MTRLAMVALILALGASVTWGLAKSNLVSASKLSDTRRTITPNDLKPAECASISVTTKIAGSGTIMGTADGDLILGSAAADTIRGLNGTDCILGGAGNDDLDGQGGLDVILGGPGDDDINGGGGNDICYGGPGGGADTFTNCAMTFP